MQVGAVLAGKLFESSRESNPLGNLPSKAARMWEAVYKSAQDRGADKGAAAAQAWCAVKRRYKKDGARWVLRKRPLGPNEQPEGCASMANPERSENAYLGDAVSLARSKKDKEEWKRAGKKGPPPFCPTGNPGDLKALKSKLLR